MVIRGRWPPLVDGRLRNANDTLILQLEMNLIITGLLLKTGTIITTNLIPGAGPGRIHGGKMGGKEGKEGKEKGRGRRGRGGGKRK